MNNFSQYNNLLLSTKDSLALDAEAQAEWGFNTFSLIEAAGRSCAQVFAEAFPGMLKDARVTVAVGTGNNGADAMAMLRYWILAGLVDPAFVSIVVHRTSRSGDTSPRAELLKSLKMMKVRVLVWDGDLGEAAGRASDDALAHSNIIVDGITGTGLTGALTGLAFEMVQAINIHRNKTHSFTGKEKRSRRAAPFVVSVDIPSGNSDSWEIGMPIIEADLTLAIEPRKHCIYTPAARPYAGIILPVGGIFPHGLIAGYKGEELLDWEIAGKRIPKIRPDVYKNERGTVEIRAGSPGATGAAIIAARGAQAAGAGLVRLVADDEIYPILASRAGGIIVIPGGKGGSVDFIERGLLPDSILLGPGWGIKPERALVLKHALALEKKGTPLILDADAIELARDKVFHGNTILTPHPGEFSRLSGIEKEKLLCRPGPILLKYAKERKAVILFKGHVTTIASPDGRMAVVDGMTPALATGGSGDLLAGFCAAIAARMVKEDRGFDGYTCATAAAALMDASARSKGFRDRFSDPLELAGRAAELAGQAWLGSERQEEMTGLTHA